MINILSFLNKILEDTFTLPFWMREFFGHTLGDYALAMIVFFLLWGLLLAAHWLVLAVFRLLASRTKKRQPDETFAHVIGTMSKWFYAFLALYAAVSMLTISLEVAHWFKTILIIWAGYQAVLGALVIIDHILERFFVANTDSLVEGEEDESARTFIGSIVHAIVWIAAGLFILDMVGVNIGSFATGLGIGGVIIAFALQSVLADLFSTFVIHAEKPFKPGDFIVVGEHRGTVKTIGIKTTRIQALQGEEIIISNQEMTSARVQNFKKMEERRVVSSVGIVYDTQIEKVKNIPGIIKDIIEKQEGIRFDRSHFRSLGPSSLDFEYVYYVLSGEYAPYMDVQEKINLGIMEAFAQESIEFAFPTQMVYTKELR
ncbi:MAG: mechanosensitive ion channel family protein [Candidatus Yonathbacteria bacterium]|nr:mechanosensitive ion channel family protein [Candidatus Yonathbacteria bacterium]